MFYSTRKQNHSKGALIKLYNISLSGGHDDAPTGKQNIYNNQYHAVTFFNVHLFSALILNKIFKSKEKGQSGSKYMLVLDDY